MTEILLFFATVLLGVIEISGLGGLFFWLLFNTGKKRNAHPYDWIDLFPEMLLTGLIINYGLTLAVNKITVSLPILMILGTIGFALFLREWFKTWQSGHQCIKFKMNQVFIIASLIIILIPIMLLPLREWDARSIWFFHAKMIYSANSIGVNAGWLEPQIAFSHPDYPNLIPALAAQITTLFGFWNEYLPKLSLFFVFFPIPFMLFRYKHHLVNFIFLTLIMLLPANALLWSGYMDGYFAIYFAFSILFFSRFIISLKEVDLISFAVCLIFLLYLKNEGMLTLICGVLLVVVYLFTFKRPLRDLKIFTRFPFISFMAGLLFPIIYWSGLKASWNLQNDLQLGSFESIKLFIERLQDGTLRLLLKQAFFQICFALMALLVILLFVQIKKIYIPKQFFLVLLFPFLYALGIISVYLLTPYDIVWHLTTSISRTFLAVNYGFWIAGYILIENGLNWSGTEEL
ncbi:hypothetical protein SDC9_60150 [bioreactor metagenome]|uniref:Glycosyltransferase RgtA/B/C/D-like domain-containing protein n=1 Tax=bioreactor metagenome TaxID=1076179 RepID=A0A644XDH2_9ZZZZ